MEGNLAATYALIYHFLKQQSQNKAAEAVKKAAKTIVVLRDDIEQEGPPLQDIIKGWKAKEITESKGTDSSSAGSDSPNESTSDSEDSSSSDSSSADTSDSESGVDNTSDSDSSDDSGDSDEAITAKKLPQKAVERDTSVTLSSVGENAQAVAKQGTQTPKKPVKDKVTTKDKGKGSESDSSDSDTSDPDSSSQSSASDGSNAKLSSRSTGSSSDSDSSDEDGVSADEKVPSNKTRIAEGRSTSSDESDSESKPEVDARVAKKRKTSDNGTAVTTAVANGSQQIVKAGKEKPCLRVKERFQRVKVPNMASELLLNNGYEARGGVANDYGERAHRDLIATRGAGFRKEKNKKKRGSYRGGEITMENHSIKFDF